MIHFLCCRVFRELYLFSFREYTRERKETSNTLFVKNNTNKIDGNINDGLKIGEK